MNEESLCFGPLFGLWEIKMSIFPTFLTFDGINDYLINLENNRQINPQ